VVLMVSFARAKVLFQGGNVTVVSGSFRHSWPWSEWSEMVRRSHVEVVRLGTPADASTLVLYRGILLRASTSESCWSVEGFLGQNVVRPQDNPPERGSIRGPLEGSAPGPLAGYLPALPQTPQFPIPPSVVTALTNAFLANQYPSTRMLLALASKGAIDTAQRFVQRNLLKQPLSRYIPQDEKIAVAVRDGGTCTALLPDGSRCHSTEDLQYHHHLIPFSKGGPNKSWNLTLHCGQHNLDASDSMPVLDGVKDLVRRWFP
jgi:hypothetical protein